MTNPVVGSYEISDASPKIKGFGVALLMAQHTYFPGVREYSADSDGLSAMRADGFSVDSNAYHIASTYCSQTPHGTTFKIGRLNSTANTETVVLTVISAVAGDRCGVSISSGADPVQEIEYTIPDAATTSTVAAALRALIQGVLAQANWATVVNVNAITCTRNVATKPLRLRGFTRNITCTDTTGAAGYASDLAAANTEDPDWYYLLVEGRSAAAIAAAQAFAEANGKFFMGLCADYACVDPASTTDALYVGALSGLHRGPVIASRDRNGNADAALVSRATAYEPGKFSYANVSGLSGPRVDSWSVTEQNAIEAKHGIAYRKFLGISMTSDGWAPSGRYCDLTNIGDLVVTRMLEGLTAMLAREVVVRFNARGRGLVDGELRSVLALQETEETIIPAGDSAEGWTTYVPAREDLTTNERAQRKLPRCQATFTAAGSVNNITFKVSIKI